MNDAPREPDPVARAPGAPPTPIRRGWRAHAVLAAGVNALVGVWLIVSPAVLAFTDGDSRWNPIVCGVLVFAIAVGRLFGAYAASWRSVATMLLGAWLVASSFWLAESAAASWNTRLMGAIVFIVALIGAGAAAEGTRPPAERPTTY